MSAWSASRIAEAYREMAAIGYRPNVAYGSIFDSDEPLTDREIAEYVQRFLESE
jgi:hypothetical protein